MDYSEKLSNDFRYHKNYAQVSLIDEARQKNLRLNHVSFLNSEKKIIDHSRIYSATENVVSRGRTKIIFQETFMFGD